MNGERNRPREEVWRRVRIEPRDGIRYYFDDFFVGESVEVLTDDGECLRGDVTGVNSSTRNGGSCLEIRLSSKRSKGCCNTRIVNYVCIVGAYQLI